MKDVINIEIDRTSYIKLKRIKEWYNIEKRSNYNNKKMVELIFDVYIEAYKIKNIINDIFDENMIKSNDKLLKDYRSDINLDPSVKEIIESIQEYMEEQRNKKINVNNIVKTALEEYIEGRSEIQRILLRKKYIKQNVLWKEKTMLKVSNKND